MKKSHLLGMVCIAILSLSCISANAALVGRLPLTSGGIDYQAFYDTDLDITWRRNAGHSEGTKYWADAVAFVNNLTVGGVTGWRLPIGDPNCDGYYCYSVSEIGHLYYVEFGLSAGRSMGGEEMFFQLEDGSYSSFTNVSAHNYWTSTINPLDPNERKTFNTNRSSDVLEQYSEPSICMGCPRWRCRRHTHPPTFSNR